MKRPKGIEITTWFMALAFMLGLVSMVIHWNAEVVDINLMPNSTFTVEGVRIFKIIWQILSVAISAAAIVFYWKGRSWARILVLLQSLFFLSNILKLRLYWQNSRLGGAEGLFYVLLAIFLLWYLFQPQIRDWFKEQALLASPKRNPQSA